jgi:hypothetical protein
MAANNASFKPKFGITDIKVEQSIIGPKLGMQSNVAGT